VGNRTDLEEKGEGWQSWGKVLKAASNVRIYKAETKDSTVNMVGGGKIVGKMNQKRDVNPPKNISHPERCGNVGPN